MTQENDGNVIQEVEVDELLRPKCAVPIGQLYPLNLGDRVVGVWLCPSIIGKRGKPLRDAIMAASYSREQLNKEATTASEKPIADILALMESAINSTLSVIEQSLLLQYDAAKAAEILDEARITQDAAAEILAIVRNEPSPIKVVEKNPQTPVAV